MFTNESWFYLNRVAGPHSLFSSTSDCRSRDHKFKSQLDHISFVEIDHKIISTVILHLPRIQEAYGKCPKISNTLFSTILA